MFLLWQTLRGTAGLLSYALYVLATVHLIVDIGFGLILSVLCFVVAADGSVLRGVIAVLVGLTAAISLGFVLGGHIATSLAIARAVKQAGLGTKVLTALLKIANPALLEEGAKSELTPDEFSEQLHSAGQQLLKQEDEDSSLNFIQEWMFHRIQRVLVWITVKVAVIKCSVGKGTEKRISLAKVRELVSGKIDDYIIDSIRNYNRDITLQATGIVTVITMGLSYGIRYLPF